MLRRFRVGLVVILAFHTWVAPWESSYGSEQIIRAHSAGAVGVAFSADGRQIASAGNRARFRILGVGAGRITGEVTIWDTSTWQKQAELPGLKAAVTSVAFSPDGKFIAAGGGGNAEAGKDYALFVWNSASFTLRNKLRLSGPVTSVAFSQDGKRLAAGMHGHETDEIARVWDIETMGELHAFHTEGLRGSCQISVAFAPDGKHLATARYAGALAGQLKIWNLASGQLEETIAGNGGARCVAYSADGRFLATGRPEADISLYATPGQLSKRILRGHELTELGGVWALAFSPSNYLLASAGADDTIRLWDTTQNQPVEPGDSDHKILRGHTGLVRDISFAPDGKRLACASNDGTIRIWNIVDKRDRTK